MFAYLLESERKACNPLSFCKTYTMDHQPLHTGEQKDMAERTEEMTPELKDVVKYKYKYVCNTSFLHLFHPAPFQISVAHDSLFRCKRASTQVNDVSIEDLFSQQKKWL